MTIEEYAKKIGYKGCQNCEYQISPFRACEWEERGGDGIVHTICTRWQKRTKQMKRNRGKNRMKVVIDLSEDDYWLACNHPEALIDVYARAIKNGTPLTKKCGRLIDVDALEEKVEKHYKTLKISEYDRDLILHYTDVEMAPTVIKADIGDIEC